MKRILFISHAADFSGAPISLATLVRYFRRQRSWDTRMWVLRDGPNLAPFQYEMPTVVLPRDWDAGTTTSLPWWAMIRSLAGGHPRQAFKIGSDYWSQKWGRGEAALAWRKLREHGNAWGPDLVYANTIVTARCLKELDPSCPIVVHVRELGPILEAAIGEHRKFLEQRVSLFLAVSEAVRSELLKQLRVPPDRTCLAPVALDTEGIEQSAGSISRNKIREELGAAPHEPLVGAVGTVNSRKGADLFLEIGKRVLNNVDERDRPRFVWVGGGSDLEWARQEVERAGLGTRMQFLGGRTNPYPYMRCFYAHLMASRWDPFPRVNLETALLGVPTIAFADSGGSREFVDDTCGCLIPDFDVEDAAGVLAHLVTDPDLRSQLGEQARQKAKALYDVENVAAPLLTLLDTFLESRRMAA